MVHRAGSRFLALVVVLMLQKVIIRIVEGSPFAAAIEGHTDPYRPIVAPPPVLRSHTRSYSKHILGRHIVGGAFLFALALVAGTRPQ